MTNTDIFAPLASLPYPAVLMDEKGEVIDRNRLAQKLLPPPYRLKRILGKKEFPREGSFSRMYLEDISYFVGVLPWKGYKIAVFLENFLPFYEPLSALLLGEMDSLLWKMIPEEEEKSLPTAFLDSFAARTYRLRQEQKGYLRLLALKDQGFSKPTSCSLEGFFRHLSSILEKKGFIVESICPEGAAVRIDSSALSFLILNLVHFAYLATGEYKIRIAVSKEKNGYKIALKFSDDKSFLSAMESLLIGENLSPRALFSIPFLCVARLCQREDFPWSVKTGEKEIRVELSLPASDALPDTFLSEGVSEEVKELLRAEKEYFS